MTRREQILTALTAALAGATGVGPRIFRSRQDAMTRAEALAIQVQVEREEPRNNVVPYIEKELVVAVIVYVRGDIPDQLADATCQSAHAKIMADTTLGGLAIDISEDGTDWQMEEADETGGLVTMRYRIWYRHLRQDLAA